MARFKVTETTHVSWTVANVEKAVARFRDLWGYQVLAQIDGPADVCEILTKVKDAPLKIAHLRAPDGSYVELIQYLGPADKGSVRNRPCDTGAAHIALGVDDLDAAVDEAKKHDVHLMNGVMELYDKDFAGVKACYLKDPDGIMIELIQWNANGNPFRKM